MLGAIFGDLVGSVCEWNNVKTKGFQPLVAQRTFVTDDTVLTVGVADARFGMSDDLARAAWERFPDDLRQVLKALHAAAGTV